LPPPSKKRDHVLREGCVMKRSRLFLTLACAAAIAWLARLDAQNAGVGAGPSASAAAPAKVAKSLNRYLAAETELGRFSGAVLVVRDGVVVFRKGYGFADVSKRAAFTPDTQSAIASISKMFTARAVLKLRGDGKLRLTDSICDHLSACPDAWKPVTIEEVLRHTSGIPDYEGALEFGSEKYEAFMQRPGSTQAILDDAKKLPLDFGPGSKFHYSNTGYVVLSFIVQQVSGQPFGAYLTEQVLQPAGMSHSGVFGYGAAPASLARGYTHDDQPWPEMLHGVSLGNENLKPVPVLPLAPPHGDAGMFSTVDDLARWSAQMDGGATVPQADIAEIFSPGRDYYGFGWMIGDAYGAKRYEHMGMLPGYDSALIKFPAEKLTIVILSNLDRIRLEKICDTVSAIALGKPFDMPVTGTVVKLTAADQAALVGSYKLSDGRVVIIAADGDSISAQVKDNFLAGLVPLAATTFYMPMSDGSVRFTVRKGHAAESINLHYDGEDHGGPRVPD
jgi:CubicO group peptidase (beta-lactamase class C family)